MQMNLRGTLNTNLSKDFLDDSKNEPDKSKSDNLVTNIKKNELTKEKNQSIKEVINFINISKGILQIGG